jgi:3-hydroxyacyl-CoA dehydrogenase
MSSAKYELHGSTAVITLDNPPVNGLGYDLRCGIVAGIDKAAADPAVRAVVLIGSDRAFSSRPVPSPWSPRSVASAWAAAWN